MPLDAHRLRLNGATSAATLAALALAILAGFAVVASVVILQNAGYKIWVIAIGLLMLPVAVAITGRPKEVLLFSWVFSLTYNRQYYVFEPIVGYNGTQGPYVMLADAFLLGLFAWWAYEALVLRRHKAARGPVLWPAFLPFAAICFLSIFVAARPDWAAYEMIRIAKLGLILYYVRYNIGRREWRAILAGLAGAVFFQSAVAMKEVITGRAGVIGLSKVADAPTFVTQHLENGGFTGGVVRGVGTLAHPPYLSCYLLLVLPVLLAVALRAPRRRGTITAVVFLVGCGGLAATLSRWPWALAAGQAALVLFGLVLLRQIAVHRAIGLTIIGIFALGLALIPLRHKIIDRFTGDFGESVSYRADGAKASLAAIADRPWLGFGLNNTSLYIDRYLPEMSWALVTERFASETIHLRAPIALGNGLLHVAEETGVSGLLAFLFFVGSGLWLGLRAIARTSGEPQAICLGLTVGLIGVMAEQIIDAPLWVDPILFTFTFFIGLLNVAPVVFRSWDAEAEEA